jgi:hypothetical protein
MELIVLATFTVLWMIVGHLISTYQVKQAFKKGLQAGFDRGVRHELYHSDAVWIARMAQVSRLAGSGQQPLVVEHLVGWYALSRRLFQDWVDDAIRDGLRLPDDHGELEIADERIAEVKAQLEGENK